MPWELQVAGIVSALFPGLEDGHAIADVLFGDVNPSARTPVTFPKNATQTPLKTPQQYPGVGGVVTYSEGLLVGYRWYDAKNETPLYPFGFGLSYTQFRYTNLKVISNAFIYVSVQVTNIGSVDGAEVAQLYLGYPLSAAEPPRVLRGFQKIFLTAGETGTVTFDGVEKPTIWDVNSHQWQPVGGTFTIFVGASSRDIRAQTTIVI